MASQRSRRLVGTFADRRLSGCLPEYRRSIFARGRCAHLTEWPEVSPRRGDLVWCARCQDYQPTAYIYSHPEGYMNCGAKSRAPSPDKGLWSESAVRLVELFCGLPAGHAGDHYDEAFFIAWEVPEPS